MILLTSPLYRKSSANSLPYSSIRSGSISPAQWKRATNDKIKGIHTKIPPQNVTGSRIPRIALRISRKDNIFGESPLFFGKIVKSIKYSQNTVNTILKATAVNVDHALST